MMSDDDVMMPVMTMTIRMRMMIERMKMMVMMHGDDTGGWYNNIDDIDDSQEHDDKQPEQKT